MFRTGDRVKIVKDSAFEVLGYKLGFKGTIVEKYSRLVSDQNVYLVRLDRGGKVYYYGPELRFENEEDYFI